MALRGRAGIISSHPPTQYGLKYIENHRGFTFLRICEPVFNIYGRINDIVRRLSDYGNYYAQVISISH
jgi:hypothetical protein